MDKDILALIEQRMLPQSYYTFCNFVKQNNMIKSNQRLVTPFPLAAVSIYLEWVYSNGGFVRYFKMFFSFAEWKLEILVFSSMVKAQKAFICWKRLLKIALNISLWMNVDVLMEKERILTQQSEHFSANGLYFIVNEEKFKCWWNKTSSQKSCKCNC